MAMYLLQGHNKNSSFNYHNTEYEIYFRYTCILLVDKYLFNVTMGMSISIRGNVSVNILYLYLNLTFYLLLCQSGWTQRISMEKFKGHKADEAKEMLTHSD